MNIKDFSVEISKKAEQIGLYLNCFTCNKLYIYMNLLLEWNKKINLTAITEPKEVILKHFIDSLTIEKYISSGEKVLDIGTGAGFPGIPLNICKQDTQFILADSLNKRVLFLKEVIKELELENIDVIHGRAEDLAQEIDHREIYDIVTSRAVARLNLLLEYMLPFTKIGGICICMKGSEIEEEIEEAKKALELLGGRIEEVKNLLLPDSDITRNIVIIKKVKGTPKKYPRKAGTPAKEPLR